MAASARYDARALRAMATIGVAAALLVAGCGGDDGPTPEEQVRAKLSELGKATAAKDYATLCRRVLAPDLVKQVTQIGLSCEAALEKGLGAVQEPRLTIGRVTVRGDRATAEVSSSAAGQDPSKDVVELVRVEDEWRVGSLAGQATPAPPADEP